MHVTVCAMYDFLHYINASYLEGYIAYLMLIIYIY